MKLLLNARPITLLIVGIIHLIPGVMGHHENYGTRYSCNKLDCSTFCLASTCVAPLILWLILMGLFLFILFGICAICYHCRLFCRTSNCNEYNGRGKAVVAYHNYDPKIVPVAQPAMFARSGNRTAGGTHVTTMSPEEAPKNSGICPPPSYHDCVCVVNVKRET